MDEMGFTAGVTLRDNRVFTVDVTGVDAEGISYRSEEGPSVVAWSDVKAVMLATPDHMLESGGYLFSMAELVNEQEQAQPYDADAMRRFGLNLLTQAAPSVCPRGQECGLKPRSGAPPD